RKAGRRPKRSAIPPMNVASINIPRKLEPSTEGNTCSLNPNEAVKTVLSTPTRKTSKRSKNKGTAIGSAMAAAANRLNDQHSKSRALVLLTDGENNAGKIPPNTAAEAIKALHTKLYAIGAGINGIAPVPIIDRNGPVTDAMGNIYYQNQRVEFNEAGLKEVAQIASGQFFRATDTNSLEQIYTDIDKMEKSTVSVKKYQQYRDLFPVCLMAGAGVLLAELL